MGYLLLWGVTQSLPRGLELTLRMYCNSAAVTVVLLLYIVITQISDTEITTLWLQRFSSPSSDRQEVTTCLSSKGLHQRSVNRGEVLPRTGSQKEGAPRWWRAWSARLHFRRTGGEKQVGRVQRQPEEREGGQVRQQRHVLTATSVSWRVQRPDQIKLYNVELNQSAWSS